jgi:very-short-patch-repair endonuclease
MVAAIATRQYGVVTIAQLREAGLTDRAIRRRVEAGRLKRIHRGVYLAGPVMPPRGREMAAVLACGPMAFLSHTSAAAVLRLLDRPPADAIEVTVVGRNPGRKPGIRVHRVAALDARDRGRWRGIPVTSPARVLLDIAGIVDEWRLERAVAEAYALRLTSERQLEGLLARTGPHRGKAALRSIVEGGKPALTRSEAEERLLALIREADLSRPEVNTMVGGFEVDFFWREHRLVVEVDGYAFHSSRAAFERDRRRDGALQAAGFHVIRLTWRQIVAESDATAALLARALATPTPASPRGRGGAP